MSSMMSTKNRPFLPGYLPSLENAIAKKRYKEKLDIIGGLDPYEIVRSEPNNEFCFKSFNQKISRIIIKHVYQLINQKVQQTHKY